MMGNKPISCKFGVDIMITVKEAEDIILSQVRDYGVDELPFEAAFGRVLADDIRCDRDLPAYNRVTMDGIAVSYAAIEQGINIFRIKATQAAGDKPIEIDELTECIEIMTGAAQPVTADTVVPYEQITIDNGIATLATSTINKGQNIHYKGRDRKQNDIVVPINSLIDAAVINIAATVGKATLAVRTRPRILIVSTGDELVEVDETPTDYQLRRSNSFSIQAVLQHYALEADMLHLPDEPFTIENEITEALSEYDVLIFSGGVSAGKYDHVPKVLEEVGVHQLFHKIKQRPGKPFWFGGHDDGQLVFAFPGNPVSAFMCLHRYFVLWYKRSMGMKDDRKIYAVLNDDVTFSPTLQYYMQVSLNFNEQGQIVATPLQGNGSGDLANLLESDAFMELPADKTAFKKGEVYRVWVFKNVLQ